MTHLALGRLPSEWYTLLSSSCTSTNKALSSSFFNSESRVEPSLMAFWYSAKQGFRFSMKWSFTYRLSYRYVQFYMFVSEKEVFVSLAKSYLRRAKFNGKINGNSRASEGNRSRLLKAKIALISSVKILNCVSTHSGRQGKSSVHVEWMFSSRYALTCVQSFVDQYTRSCFHSSMSRPSMSNKL